MSTYFHKFERLAAVLVMAGLTVPQVASAKDNHSGRSFSKSGQVVRSNTPSNAGNYQLKSFNNAKLSGAKFAQAGKSYHPAIKPPFGTLKPPVGTVKPPIGPVDPVKPPKGPIKWPTPIDPGKGPIKWPTPIDPGKGPIKWPTPIDPGKGPIKWPIPIDPGKGPVGPVKPPADPPANPPANPPAPPTNPPSNGNHHHHHFPWQAFLPYPSYYGNGPYYPTYPSYPTQTVVVAPAAEAQVATSPAAGSADLLLEDVQLVEGATILVGPAYRVKFRNQGQNATADFRVGLVATMGSEPSEKSPQAAVQVSGLAGGQSGEVTIRLPKSAMQLVSTAGQSAAFTHLLVAVDFDGTVNESDKTNNLAVLERAQLEAAAR
jgi:CARDB